MSFDAITTFFVKVQADPALHARVQAALDERGEAAAYEIVDIAAGEECSFSATELREYIAAGSPDGELSEEQLEAVAGGVLNIRMLNLGGIRKIRGLRIDTLRARRIGKKLS